jgi:NAD(P)-dependent dehydrogenase (short-subunit alcohol dehydrogenase family)
LVCKHGISRLIEAGGGSVIIVASQLGRVVVPRRPAYVTGKVALIQLRDRSLSTTPRIAFGQHAFARRN